jgi:hypothetical protein
MTKYFAATFAFIFVLFGTAMLCGFLMNMLFPPSHDLIFAGIGLDWRNLPGTVIGLFAGIHSAKVSIRKGREREARLDRST